MSIVASLKLVLSAFELRAVPAQVPVLISYNCKFYSRCSKEQCWLRSQISFPMVMNSRTVCLKGAGSEVRGFLMVVNSRHPDLQTFEVKKLTSYRRTHKYCGILCSTGS